MGKVREKRMDRRYTVSFSQQQAEGLEKMAERNDVTVSWVVRLAVDNFLRSHRDPQLRLKFDSTADKSSEESQA